APAPPVCKPWRGGNLARSTQLRGGERRVCLVEIAEAEQREAELDGRSVAGNCGQRLLRQLLACDRGRRIEVERLGMQGRLFRSQDTGPGAMADLSRHAQPLGDGRERR